MERGRLICGVSEGLPGFSDAAGGRWSGLDVDTCQALSAAIFADPEKVKFIPLSARHRFKALQDGEIDILSRHTAWTQYREEKFNLTFSATNFVESLGFMVPKSLGAASARDLRDVTLCSWRKNKFQEAAAKYLREAGVDYRTETTKGIREAFQAYDQGRCNVFPFERTGLGAQRNFRSRPSDHAILPDTLTKLRLAPYVRDDDRAWSDIVKWTLNALIVANEKGITSDNVDASVKSPDGETRRLLSVEGEACEKRGLPTGCFLKAIRAVGNYSQMFERNVGPGTWMNLGQGLNKPHLRGGELYSLSF